MRLALLSKVLRATAWRLSSTGAERTGPVRTGNQPGHPNLPLRMGVHSGPVIAVFDVNDQTGAAGAGIHMAQRVMDCGDAGHILLSKHVAEDLEQYGHWELLLHDLGECEVKHGVPVFEAPLPKAPGLGLQRNLS